MRANEEGESAVRGMADVERFLTGPAPGHVCEAIRHGAGPLRVSEQGEGFGLTFWAIERTINQPFHEGDLL